MKIPAPLRPLYNAWMAFSQALGKAMSAILLTVVWVVVFGVYAVVLKIIALFQREDSAASTWKDCPPQDEKSMHHSF